MGSELGGVVVVVVSSRPNNFCGGELGGCENATSAVGAINSFVYMGVNPKIMGPPPKSSILIGFSIIFTIHFGGNIPLFLETPILRTKRHSASQLRIWESKSFSSFPILLLMAEI